MTKTILPSLALAALALAACDSTPPEPTPASPITTTKASVAIPKPSATAPAAAARPPKPKAPPPMDVAFVALGGGKLKGNARFEAVDGDVKVTVRLEDAPKGKHAVAMHENADCSAKDGKSAGALYAVSTAGAATADSSVVPPAGSAAPAAGSAAPAASGAPAAGGALPPGVLGNLVVGDDGRGELVATLKGAKLTPKAVTSVLDNAVVVHSAAVEGPEMPKASKRIACGEIKGPHPGLLDPSQAAEKAPETFQAKLVTTQGEVVIEVTRKWSPNGADRFYNMVKIGFLTDVALFRAVKGFMVQFGISGDPNVSRAWRTANIQDDKVIESNKKGYVTFAKTGAPNSRSTQIFINYGDNSRLDKMGFSPFGKVIKGMDVVEKFYQGYGEKTTQKQGDIQAQGNAYLHKNYPELDYIKSASIIEPAKQ